MKIRKKLTLQFTILVATILICFSVAVFFLYAIFREQEFYKRLETKANLIGKILILHNKLNKELLDQIDRKDLITVVDEQEYIYNAKNELIYKTDVRSDFSPTPYLMMQVRQKKEVDFKYKEMEGVGFLYKTADNEFIIFALGYDLYGFNKLENLRWILLIGNPIAVLIVLVAGYWFAVGALRPIADIVLQVDSISASNLEMRVETKNTTDEIGLVAETFNKMLDRVEYAFDLQKSFVSGASHELRTPLTIIQGNLELSLMQDKTFEESQKSIQIVLQEVKQMTELTNGLLNMARMTENHSELTMTELRIDELIIDLIVLQKQKYPDKQIQFIFDMQNDELENFIVIGNEHLLKIAIGNIIENACKYSKEPRIDIKIRSWDNMLYLEIKDYGIGIDKEDILRIQTPFFRGKNTGKIKGFGIGLSLTRKIINIHKGILTIASEIGKGTNIFVEIPLAFSQKDKVQPENTTNNTTERTLKL